MNVRIIQNNSTEELQKDAATSISNFLKGNDVLLLLSGGSALTLLQHIDPATSFNKLTITVLDERFNTDPHVNNFSQIMKTSFYQSTIKNGAKNIDTRVTAGETIGSSARRFENELRSWKTRHPSGLTVATQGVGLDGHTSGILPFAENSSLFARLFEDDDRWVTGYDAGDKNKYPTRVTTTIPFLKMIDHSILYATGEDKKSVLKKALSPETKLHEFPARIIQDMKDVRLYTDQILV
jgi:6-phosphogluconolactonase/glucosamine-6-phosphate isomerase/deaminase